MVMHSVGSLCVDLARLPDVVRLVLGMAVDVAYLALFVYALYLSREATNAFVSGHCLFFEAMAVAFKRSVLLLPSFRASASSTEADGPAIVKKQPVKSNDASVKTLSRRTRFD